MTISRNARRALQARRRTVKGSGAATALRRLLLAGDRLALDSLVIAVASILSGVAAFAVRIVMGRTLDIAEFGIVFSLIALTDFILTARGGVQAAVAREASRLTLPAERRVAATLWRVALRRYGLLGLGAFVVAGALSPLVADLLALKSAGNALLAAAMGLLVFLLAVNSGVLQGLQRFGASALLIVFVPVARLVVALVVLVGLGMGATGGILAYVGGGVLTFAAGAAALRLLLRGDPGGPAPHLPWRAFWGDSLVAFAATLGLTALIAGDVIIARIALAEEPAGIYAGVAALGTIPLILTATISFVMFPKTARRQALGGNPWYVVAIAVAYTVAVTLIPLAVIAADPRWILATAFGEGYRGGGEVLVLYMTGMFFLSIIFLLTHYGLSLGIRWVAVPVAAAAIVQSALLLGLGDSMREFVGLRLAVAALAAGGIVFVYLLSAAPRLRWTTARDDNGAMHPPKG